MRLDLDYFKIKDDEIIKVDTDEWDIHLFYRSKKCKEQNNVKIY